MNWSEQITSFNTLLRKEVTRFMRIWMQTILPPAITTVLYFIIFGKLIGSQLRDIGGYSYIDYIVPGLILMAVITNSYANVVASFFNTKFNRNIEEMLISPMPNYIILAGFIGGGVARGVAVGIVVYAVSTFFTTLPLSNLPLALIILVLTAVLFSLIGLINGIYARNFDDISVIPTFVLTPLTYLGGIFYSVEMLPSPWRDISLLNPILYMINGFRRGLLGISDINPGTSIMITLGFTVMLTALALYLLHRGVRIKN